MSTVKIKFEHGKAKKYFEHGHTVLLFSSI